MLKLIQDFFTIIPPVPTKAVPCVNVRTKTHNVGGELKYLSTVKFWNESHISLKITGQNTITIATCADDGVVSKIQRIRTWQSSKHAIDIAQPVENTILITFNALNPDTKLDMDLISTHNIRVGLEFEDVTCRQVSYCTSFGQTLYYFKTFGIYVGVGLAIFVYACWRSIPEQTAWLLIVAVIVVLMAMVPSRILVPGPPHYKK